MRYKIRRNY